MNSTFSYRFPAYGWASTSPDAPPAQNQTAHKAHEHPSSPIKTAATPAIADASICLPSTISPHPSRDAPSTQTHPPNTQTSQNPKPPAQTPPASHPRTHQNTTI